MKNQIWVISHVYVFFFKIWEYKKIKKKQQWNGPSRRRP